jgi:hypothetical protein
MIDTWLPRDGWPPDVVASMRRFRQGHVFEWNSFAYGTAFSHAVLTTTKAGGDAAADRPAYVKVDDAWPFVIITSQTCDIVEDGKRLPRIPWISVAPVYDILPSLRPGQANQIRANGFGHLVPLTNPRFATDGRALWVADLRLEFPLEKSVLVNQSPIEAFSSEDQYAYYAEKLASRRRRPAIDSRVRRCIIAPLGAAIGSGAIQHDSILEVRIFCGPSWDHVELAELLIVVRDSADIEAIEAEFDEWQDEVLNPLLPSDLRLLRTKIESYSNLRFAQYRRSASVDFSDVSDPETVLRQVS